MKHTAANTEFLAWTKNDFNYAIYKRVLQVYNEEGELAAWAELGMYSLSWMEKAQERAERERSMFGDRCTSTVLDADVRSVGAKRLVMSLMSDAQELIALGRDYHLQDASDLMNRAKYVTDTYLS